MSDVAAVLVIEDEAPTRALLQVTLKQQGYRCLHAATGAEGLTLALSRDPAVVLLDLGGRRTVGNGFVECEAGFIRRAHVGQSSVLQQGSELVERDRLFGRVDDGFDFSF